ncbi:C-terminal processing protease CtpA/Prc [Roseivirga pacifica]|uniref:Tricorn protease homolog n=1 Tax=Roseivirga pacifica TaxID=1267423 RepID=A0A1I0P8H3_9BACT|nr:S41 family peptidase [Roseivirga pacifica]RKQ51778.1 C-terminal processing protease CtpA/Prc [Roseivirga pacifica]SEW10350.1 C-terminal processing protease CtpA/Prc, contains a PDZ domain [Roseivirga pacifica]
MRKLVILLLIFSAFGLKAQENPQWIRYQVISPNGQQIAFTYKGDLYTVPTSGGRATQLTFHKAHDYMPVWSKDGEQIAFASDRYGNFDVFVMSAKGGAAKRLTFHSSNESPFSFSHDNAAVIFGTHRQDTKEHRQYPTGSQPELYSVPVSGGRVDQIFTIPAEYVQVSNDGNTMIYHDKKGGENEWRKHHTSSITRDIWKFDKTTGQHEMIVKREGEDRQPIFTADEQGFYYLSEESGTFNVHKTTFANPSQNQQITSFDLHPVRFLSAANGTLAFGYDGELYTMREGGAPQKVNVEIVTQEIDNSDSFITINGGVREMAISPNGKEIAFVARGEVFVTSVDGSITKRITNTPEAERFVTFTPDGKSVVYAAERDGKWSIFKATREREKQEPFFFAATLIKEEVLLSNEVDNYMPQFSPDGKKMAYIADRRNLKVRDVDSGNEVALMTEDDLFHMRDGDKYFTWSPDSKWLLVDWSKLLNNSEVLLLSADGTQRHNLTQSGFYDSSPKWVNEGKQMIWFSNRNGMKSYATSGRAQSDVYSMFFTQDAWDKYQLSEEDYELMQAIEEATEAEEKPEEPADDKKSKKKKKGKEEAEEKKEESKDLTFDWENMRERKARLTIHSSNLGDAVLSKDGSKLYYLASFEGGQNLWVTDLRTRETKMAIKLGGYGSLQWDPKMENLYLLSGGRIAKIKPDSGGREGISISGEMQFDEVAERDYMFNHVWIRTKNIFYEPTFHGVDWELMRTEYEKYLPHIGNGYEFAEMLSEMLGELNVSHAGARYGTSISNADATASLGIFMDFDHQGNGILIDEVIQGGPLDKADLKVEAGMIIQKIDGEQITPQRDVASYLNRKANKFTLLEITDANGGKVQQVTIKPISMGAENGLLYERFVRINAAEVKEKSGGKLGYVHIPGMSDGPYRSIYEEMMGKYYETDAVIVDTRFNGGGDLVADLAMFFTGEPFITYATAAKVVGGEPTSRWTKPTLAMFNESNYSDGHCFAQGYTDLDIGTTLGMPTPGTCSFAGWEGLPSGGSWGVVPVSAKDKNGRWMENLQTEPDIKVKNMPGTIDAGRDEQLERAIQQLMSETGN